MHKLHLEQKLPWNTLYSALNIQPLIEKDIPVRKFLSCFTEEQNYKIAHFTHTFNQVIKQAADKCSLSYISPKEYIESLRIILNTKIGRDIPKIIVNYIKDYHEKVSPNRQYLESLIFQGNLDKLSNYINQYSNEVLRILFMGGIHDTYERMINLYLIINLLLLDYDVFSIMAESIVVQCAAGICHAHAYTTDQFPKNFTCKFWPLIRRVERRVEPWYKLVYYNYVFREFNTKFDKNRDYLSVKVWWYHNKYPYEIITHISKILFKGIYIFHKLGSIIDSRMFRLDAMKIDTHKGIHWNHLSVKCL